MPTKIIITKINIKHQRIFMDFFSLIMEKFCFPIFLDFKISCLTNFSW